MVALVDVGDLDLDVGVEGLVDDLAGLDVLQLGAHERAALAGLVVLEPDDGPQLPVEVENHAVLQVVGGCHAQLSPVVVGVVSYGGRGFVRQRRTSLATAPGSLEISGRRRARSASR